MSERNFFKPGELGQHKPGSVEVRVEGSEGIVAMSGAIDAEHGPLVEAAADEHIQNPKIELVVFDFEGTSFFLSDHVGILVRAHRKTHLDGTKRMLLRNIEPGGEIFQLLEACQFNHIVPIEGIDDLEGKDAWKIRVPSFHNNRFGGL